MERRTSTVHAISHATWWTGAVVVSAVVECVVAFRPWFQLDTDGLDLSSVLRMEETGWQTALGLSAVLAALCAGVFAVLPFGQARNLHVVVAVLAALLAVGRLLVPASVTIFGETLSYSRTGWLTLGVVAVVVEAGCAVLSASLRNQERVE